MNISNGIAYIEKYYYEGLKIEHSELFNGIMYLIFF